MQHGTKIPGQPEGYPHPPHPHHPPPQYTQNPPPQYSATPIFPPPVITQQPGKIKQNTSIFNRFFFSVQISFEFFKKKFQFFLFLLFLLLIGSVHVVHVHQVPAVGPQPTMVVCMNCNKNVMTRLEYEASARTHIVALICCLFG